MRILDFIRSGYINLNNDQARNVGLEASTHSRTSNSAANAYYLNSNNTNVNPSNANNRYYGFPPPLVSIARAVPIFEKASLITARLKFVCFSKNSLYSIQKML